MNKLLSLLLLCGATAFSGTASAAQPLVDVAWVKANGGKAGVVLLDVRGKFSGVSKTVFMRGHIPGAIYTNYFAKKNGWRSKGKDGTPGMLSSVKTLEKLVGGLGIDNNTHVVLIPGGTKALNLGTATRIYWTFKVLGHDNVSILNGGMAAYTKDVDKKTKKPVNPLEKGFNKPKAKTFKANLRPEMILTKAQVKKAIGKTALIDIRPAHHYLGVNRHGKSKRNGTLPGAKNVPADWFTKNGGGAFRSKAVLEKLYSAAGAQTSGDQITFCNSGHYATVGWFASSEILGNKSAKIYDGSMIQWSADKSLPVEQKVKY